MMLTMSLSKGIHAYANLPTTVRFEQTAEVRPRGKNGKPGDVLLRAQPLLSAPASESSLDDSYLLYS